MNKKQTERIALAAFLVGMFLYQVAYGMNETVTSGNITATITAPNGSTINNVTITPLPQMVDLTGTWHSGATGTITFTHHYHKFKYDWGGPVDIDKATFTSTVGDRTFKGYWDFDQPPPPYTAYLKLC